jgi:serine/threonine protein phosphatase PrpC
MAKKTPASVSGFTSYALSDQGIRSNNEDLVHHDDERGIYFVVDGMGGHAAGEQAAQIAGERLRGRLERATGTAPQRIREAIALANNAIFEAAEKNPDWTGMACVLTVAVVEGGSATIGHVGDSRLYKIRGESMEKITLDHSPVGELEDSKEITEGTAMMHPRRNEVFRDVGSQRRDPGEPGFIDIYEIEVEPDSALLLCSDGLTDAVPKAEIQRILREQAKRPDRAVEALVECAKKREGKDNISVVLVRGPAFGAAAKTAKRLPEPMAGPVEPVVKPPAIRVIQKPVPVWRWIVWAALWMAAGAALFAVGQRLIPRTQNAPTQTTEVTHRPSTIVVDARQPQAQPTIAAALAKAAEGDTIELSPGMYDEPVRIEKSNLTLNGSGALLHPKPTSEGSDGVTIVHAAGIHIRNLRIAGDADGNLLTGVHILDSQVTLHNVHVVSAAGPGIETGGTSTLNMDGASVRDCSGPGLLLRGSLTANIKYSAIVGNGRDPGDRQPGILNDSTAVVTLAGNTFANNGGPAIIQPDVASPELLAHNLFSLEGRKGRLEDVRVVRKRVKP